MFKKLESLPISKLFLLSLLLLALPLAACNALTGTASAAPTAPTLAAAAAETTGSVLDETLPLAAESPAAPAAEIAASIDNTAATVTDTTLNDDEIADLLFMREEEKLARDLYLAFYELWGTPVYQNIAASEQAHMDAILLLINQFGLQDPAAGSEPGVFSDPALQDLYNQLLAAGTLSQIDALLTGAAVEEIDMLDLQGSLAQTNNEAIVPVYLNLLAGSENHLRAFASSWERQTGAVYQPQYLSQDEYADIMSSSPGGNGNGQGGNGGSGQGGSGGGQGQGGQGGKGGQGQGGQGGQGNGRGGSIDNGPGGPGGRGRQSTAGN